MAGLESVSLEKIKELLEMASDVHSKVETHYYRSREGEMKNYMERFAKYMKLIEKLGIVHDRNHVYHRLLLLHRFNLDYGLLYLHFYAFLPAIELLGNNE